MLMIIKDFIYFILSMQQHSDAEGNNLTKIM